MPTSWLKYLPSGFQERIKGRSGLQKILTNTSWLFSERLLRMSIALVVGVWVARYLGPEQFGLLMYSTAVIALVSSLASLGLKSVVIRDLVNENINKNSTLGTAFYLQLFSGLLTYAGSIAVISLIRPEDQLARVIVSILGLSLILKSTDIIKYWFESQTQSKYVIWMGTGILILLSFVKIFLILTQASLIVFVWVAAIDSLITAIGLIYVYVKHVDNPGRWRFDGPYARSLLRESWPLLLSGIAIMIYMRIDQIMLGEMLGDDEVGLYSAAVRISEAWYFVPMAIVASVFPSIIRAKNDNSGRYRSRLQYLYDLMVLLALAVAVPVTFTSDRIVELLFGSAYAEASSVLAIHVWAGVFVFLGVASSKGLILDGHQKVIFYRTLIGAVVNISANWILIPVFGIIGAALATFISYFVAVFSVYLRPDTRASGMMMLKSFVVHKSIVRLRNV